MDKVDTNQQQEQQTVNQEDLDLIGQDLEDEGKEDAELWAEFDQSESAAPAADHAEDELADDSATGKPGSDDAPAGEDDGQPSSDDKAKQQQQAKPSDKDAQQRQNAQDDALWANATPEQRAAHEAAQNKLKELEQYRRSNEGRLRAFQRRIDELEGRTAPRKQGAQQAADQSAAGGKQTRLVDEILADPDLKTASDEYPEVSGPFMKAIGKLADLLEQQGKTLNSIGEERHVTAVSEQETLLTEQHPDWVDVTAKAEFAPWLDEQPRHIREAFFRNYNEIVDAAEAADVVGRFKQHLGVSAGASSTQTQGDGSGNGAGNGKGTGSETNQQLGGKRQRQLASSSSTRTKGVSVASGIAEDADEETIWKQFDAMEQRQAAG